MEGKRKSHLPNKEKTLAAIMIVILLTSLTSVIPPVDAAISVEVSRKNLSNDAANSRIPEIASSGNKVYAVWYDGTDIRFTNSTDSGVNFDSDIDIGNTGGFANPNPKIVVKDGSVFIAWKDTANIKFIRSTDDGDTFLEAEKNLGALGSNTIDSRLVLTNSSDNVMIAWADNSGNYVLRNSTDGNTFDPAITIGAVGSASGPVIDVAAGGDKKYVVWIENTDVKFKRTLGNSAFQAAQTIGFADDFSPSNIDIIANGDNVYVVWMDDVSVKFINSTDGGATMPSSWAKTIGSSSFDGVAPKLALGSDGRVFVVWEDSRAAERDIKFRSTDDGKTFQPDLGVDPTNLSGSGSSARSFSPQISTSGNFVNVVWSETNSTNVNDRDIFVKSGINNGGTFCSSIDLSLDAGFSDFPKLTSAGTKVFFSWQNKTGPAGTDAEIIFSSATLNPGCISFENQFYAAFETADFQVFDATAAGSGTIVVRISSALTGEFIDATITEATPLGNFTGSLTFSLDSTIAGSQLKVKRGDTVTASFNGGVGTAKIHPATIRFTQNGYSLSEIARIEVTDKNSNTDLATKQKITVTVTADNTGDSVNLELEETNADNSGIFGGVVNNQLLIMGANDKLSPTASMTIRHTDDQLLSQASRANNSKTTIESVPIPVKSTTSPGGTTIQLFETGDNTGIFQGKLSLGPSTVAGTTLGVLACDILEIGPLFSGVITKGFITPCTDLSKNAIRVAVTSGSADIIRAKYQGNEDAEIVNFAPGEGGGGGGGIVRPGLVIDILAGASTLGGGKDTSPPVSSLQQARFSKTVSVPTEVRKSLDNFDPYKPITALTDDQNDSFDFPLKINDNAYPLAGFSNTLETYKAKTKDPVKMRFTVLETSKLEHFTMYTNLGKSDNVYESDTYVTFHNGEYIIVDPHKFFETAKMTVSEKDFKKFIDIDLVFAKAMEKSNIIIRSWDEKKYAGDMHIVDAIEVSQSEDAQDETKSIEEKETPTQDQVNPAEDQIKQKSPVEVSTKINKESVIDWAGFSPNEKSDKEILEEAGIDGKEIPDWFKKIGRWIFEGHVTLVDFENALKNLNQRGVL